LRFLRKHRTALIALGVYHFVFFFPTLFMHRLPSPNDVFFNYSPWANVQRADVQNSVINDPPTAYFTLMSLVKGEPRAFHWNPYIGSGIPGFGSSASAVLSPFILIPTFTLPLAWVYVGIILLKLNVAFYFTYVWLRHERLGRRGAAIGAIVFAASGAYAVRWWWQATNATALYPALMWAVRRRRTPFAIVTLIALAYSLAGFPAAMAYGAYVAVGYFVFLWLRRQPRAAVLHLGLASALGVAIASPFIVPFVQFLRRSGYLAARAGSALQSLPLHHLALFVTPDRLGNNAYHSWTGNPLLGASNNYLGATVYLGLVPLALIAIAALNRRARTRWFWLAAFAFTLACMFGLRPLTFAVAHLPLMRYSPMSQLVLLLPLSAAYLCGAASSLITKRGALLAGIIAALCAADLGIFAGRFYPYITRDLAVPPMTPTLAFLREQPRPFRIAPFQNYLWPNTAELYRVEDIRSHFSSEADYRKMLRRVDPGSSSDQHTVITFDSLKFNFADPLPGMLGVRYYIEHKEIDILRWTIFANSVPAAAESKAIVSMEPGTVLQRRITIDAQPYYAIGIPVTMRDAPRPGAAIVATLSRGSSVLFRRAFTPGDITALNKLYVPVYQSLRMGDTATLQLRSIDMHVTLAPFFYERIKVPLIFDRELPDGRVFRNAGEVPRFHSVTRLTKMTHDEFLANTLQTDFRDEAILTGNASPVQSSDADVAIRKYEDDEQVIDVNAPAGTFLASSEKLTPELRVTVDGRSVRPFEINMLFAGVQVPAGKHVVVFTRRIGRGWWWVSMIALLAAVVLSVKDRRLQPAAARA
jgi:hypothetical protein